jgi:membrane fusion protein (multidrug efflux system)
LRAENTVSQSELDQVETALQQKQAEADALRATIAKKTIRAPFGGRVGIRQVNEGEYVEAGKLIVSLQLLMPVYGDFALPQQELARVRPGLPVRALTDAYPGQQFEGTLTAIDPDVNALTPRSCSGPACSPGSRCSFPRRIRCWPSPRRPC